MREKSAISVCAALTLPQERGKTKSAPVNMFVNTDRHTFTSQQIGLCAREEVFRRAKELCGRLDSSIPISSNFHPQHVTMDRYRLMESHVKISEQLIKLVKPHPELYDMNSHLYNDRAHIDGLWAQISNVMQLSSKLTKFLTSPSPWK